jgi:hypothetical protein
MRRVLIALLLPQVAAACAKKDEAAAPTPRAAADAAPATPPPPPPPPPSPPDAALPDAGPPTLETRTTHIEWHDLKADLTVQVPVGWVESSPGHFRPAGAPSMSGPYISFAFGGYACAGECKDKDFLRELNSLIDRKKANLEKPNISSDPALDAVRLDVTEIDKGTIPDGRFVAYEVKRPAGVEGPYYLGKTILCSRFRKGDKFYIYASAAVHENADQAFWPLLVEACKTAQIK